MEWANEYSIGIPEIDEQHKALVDCIARLIDARDDRQRELSVYFTLSELDDYSRVHFAVEEAIMRMFDYPGREAHVREHAGFAGYVASMQKLALQRDVREELIAYLQDWLLNHLRGADRQYADYLLANKSRLVRSGDA